MAIGNLCIDRLTGKLLVFYVTGKVFQKRDRRTALLARAQALTARLV